MARHQPIPSGLTKARVHALAEAHAQRLGFRHIDPIEPLVARLGGKIEYKTADAGSDRLPESIIVDSMNYFTIYLPSVTSSVRDRFTVAHELGHLFIHFPLVANRFPGAGMYATRWVDESDPNLVRAEWEANWFAAAFLMPGEIFKSLFRGAGGSIEALSIQFGVSTKAAEIRASTLGLSPGTDHPF